MLKALFNNCILNNKGLARVALGIFAVMVCALVGGFSASVHAQAAPVYTLGPGDKVRLMIYGEDEISGEYELDGTGALTLPLVGEVLAGGLSVREAEQKINDAYKGDYLINPRVNVEVMNYRPIFILGEVKTPGNYAYINGMTALQAVTVAGGYTYRARKNKISLRRAVDGEEKEMYINEKARVFPGDIINVEERFF